TVTSFSFSNPDTTATIVDSTHTIIVNVPFGTPVTELTPAITHTGAGIGPLSGAARDFSNPVTYTVTAADGSTRAYTVTVNVGLDTAKSVTSFSLSSPDTAGIIVDSTRTIIVNVPFGTAVTALTPVITHTGTGIDPDTGTARDFTDPVTYTATAADGTKRAYTVKVIVAPDTAKAITSFILSSPEVTGEIDDSTHSITMHVPFGTAVTALAPIITYTGAAIDPPPGSARDFSNPVAYTVTAADGSTRAYTVSVKEANALPAKMKILFVGNSITRHGPSPDLGWYGDWGMAASSEENDYVHMLISKLSNCFIPTIFDYSIETVVSWERNFSTDLSNFPGMVEYDPDICIIRLGENIDTAYAKNNNYYAELTDLITFCIDPSTKVVITGNFHPSFYKDSIQQAVALDNGWHYVDFTHIGADPANYAYGLFTDPGVASHPSDAGMKEMAISIYHEIQEILFNQ
ncbi:MAG: hypothetical protein JW913_17455, partial [Chitinispirillaceae bacterium]|nr:hypothetical protein [Chitinispirillaceae bacterium]